MRYALLILVVVSMGCREKYLPAVKTGKEGQPIPEFVMGLPDSVNYLHSRNIPDGTATVLFYYSATCPYCRAQMREMSARMADLQHIRFYILTTAPVGVIRQVSDQYKFDKFKNVTVATDTGFFMPRYFRTSKVPFTAIYGKDKKLIHAFTGKISVAQIVTETKNKGRPIAKY